MLKKTITYKDFNGVERTEDFYFNLSQAELVEMQHSKQGGLETYIKKIVDARDSSELIRLFKDLVLKAYGEKSEDGRRFIKTDELRMEFSQTQAYSDLFMALASNEQEAIAFVNGILPQEKE